MRVWPIWAALAACYQPTPPEGAPCGAADACPTGQRCFSGFCRAHADPADAELVIDQQLDGQAVPVDDSIDGGLGTWGTPTKIPGVNSASTEGDPSLTPDLLTIVFVSDRLGTDDIFIGRRAAIGDAFTVEPIAAVNTAMAEASPEISSDGNTLYFTSDSSGTFEVYRSVKANGAFGAPVLVPDLSSAGRDGDLAVSPDGLTAMVARDSRMYIATRAQPTGAFGGLTLVPSLDVMGNVAAPSITDGAASVYLHAGAVRDLYVSHRTGNSFSSPVPISELDTAARDAAPSVTPDEKHIVFERAGELFESTR